MILSGQKTRKDQGKANVWIASSLTLLDPCGERLLFSGHNTEKFSVSISKETLLGIIRLPSTEDYLSIQSNFPLLRPLNAVLPHLRQVDRFICVVSLVNGRQSRL